MNSLMDRAEVFSMCLDSDLTVYVDDVRCYFFLVQPSSQGLYVLVQYLKFSLIELINDLVFISMERLFHYYVIGWGYEVVFHRFILTVKPSILYYSILVYLDCIG